MDQKKMLRKLTIGGLLAEGGYWLAYCGYLAFTVSTLVNAGWTAGAAQAMVTVTTVLCMIAQPLTGMIVDRFLSVKKLLIAMSFASAFCFVLFGISLKLSRMLTIVSMAGVAFTAAQMYGLLDSWIVALKQEYQELNYGLIRSGGSLCYALIAQVFGTLTVACGDQVRLYVSAAAMILCAGAMVLFREPARIENIDVSKEEPAPVKITGTAAMRILFSNKQYVQLIVTAFFLSMSISAWIALVQLMIPQMGGSAAEIGTATLVLAGSEVPAMFLASAAIAKFGEKKLILFAGFFYVVRLTLLGFVNSLGALIAVQALQGLTYAVLLATAMSYLSRVADIRVRATAVTTYSALSSSLAGILGGFAASAMLTAGWSIRVICFVYAASALIGFVYGLLGVVRKRW